MNCEQIGILVLESLSIVQFCKAFWTGARGRGGILEMHFWSIFWPLKYSVLTTTQQGPVVHKYSASNIKVQSSGFKKDSGFTMFVCFGHERMVLAMASMSITASANRSLTLTECNMLTTRL